MACSKLDLAAHTFVARQHGTQLPQGARDEAGVWYPAPKEARVCCVGVEASEAFPNSFYAHCLGLDHVSRLFNTELAPMRRLVRRTRGA